LHHALPGDARRRAGGGPGALRGLRDRRHGGLRAARRDRLRVPRPRLRRGLAGRRLGRPVHFHGGPARGARSPPRLRRGDVGLLRAGHPADAVLPPGGRPGPDPVRVPDRLGPRPRHRVGRPGRAGPDAVRCRGRLRPLAPPGQPGDRGPRAVRLVGRRTRLTLAGRERTAAAFRFGRPFRFHRRQRSDDLIRHSLLRNRTRFPERTNPAKEFFTEKRFKNRRLRPMRALPQVKRSDQRIHRRRVHVVTVLSGMRYRFPRQNPPGRDPPLSRPSAAASPSAFRRTAAGVLLLPLLASCGAGGEGEAVEAPPSSGPAPEIDFGGIVTVEMGDPASTLTVTSPDDPCGEPEEQVEIEAVVPSLEVERAWFAPDWSHLALPTEEGIAILKLNRRNKAYEKVYTLSPSGGYSDAAATFTDPRFSPDGGKRWFEKRTEDKIRLGSVEPGAY